MRVNRNIIVSYIIRGKNNKVYISEQREVDVGLLREPYYVCGNVF